MAAKSPHSPADEREIKVYINAKAYIGIDPERSIDEQEDWVRNEVKRMLGRENIANFHDVEIEEVE